MKIKKINVNLKTKKYNIYIGENYLNKFGNILKKEKINFDNVLIVFDNKIPEFFVKKIKKSFKCKKKVLFRLKSSEKNKNLVKVKEIIDLLLKNNFNRNDCIIGLGGGIVGDLSCYVASIYKRGLKFINIPTTLLAQADASIGGKSGVNHKNFGKNLIGTIYQPNLVLTDTCFLKSLKKREIICGYAEVFKHTLIRDKEAFSYLNKFTEEILNLKKPYINKVIYNSCIIKKKVVEEDENENNIRKILNLGHTFGHAFEASYKFKNNLNHGEGVLLGIKCAAKFSLIKNFLSKDNFHKIYNHVEKINKSLRLNKFFKIKDINKIINLMKNDKKNNSNKINLVLLKNLGRPIINQRFNGKEIGTFLKNELNNI